MKIKQFFINIIIFFIQKNKLEEALKNAMAEFKVY